MTPSTEECHILSAAFEKHVSLPVSLQRERGQQSNLTARKHRCHPASSGDSFIVKFDYWRLQLIRALRELEGGGGGQSQGRGDGDELIMKALR